MKNYYYAIGGLVVVAGLAWWGYNYYHSPTRFTKEDKENRTIKINKKQK